MNTDMWVSYLEDYKEDNIFDITEVYPILEKHKVSRPFMRNNCSTLLLEFRGIESFLYHAENGLSLVKIPGMDKTFAIDEYILHVCPELRKGKSRTKIQLIINVFLGYFRLALSFGYITAVEKKE